MDNFLVFLIVGLASGALFAPVALGVLVSYRASGIVNFALGALGAVSAYVTYKLRADGAAPILAVCAGLGVGAVLGVVTHLALSLVRGRSVLIRFMVVLGLFTAAQSFIFLVWGPETTTPLTVLPHDGISLGGPLVVGVDRLILIGVALVFAVALAIFYRRSLFGLATTAVSESHMFLAGSGWSPARIELANHIIATVLASFAAIFLAPIIGLSGSNLALVILPALSAALAGRFESFGWTVIAAFAIGAAQGLLSNYSVNIADFVDVSSSSLSWLPTVVPLVAILALTVARGRSRLQRGETQAWLPRVGSGRIPTLPLVISLAVAALLLAFASNDWVDSLTATAGGAMIVVSLVVVTGFGGQFSLCQFALAGFGGWVAARLAATAGVPFELALLLGPLAAMLVGAAVALPSLRARGMTLAIATLALAQLLYAMVFTNSDLTNGIFGLELETPSLFGFSLDSVAHPQRYAAFGILLLLICAWVASNVRRGKAGRRLLAVRSDEAAAASLGIGVYGAKVYAFTLAAGIAGLAGTYLAFRYPNAQFEAYNAVSSVGIVQFAVLGGIGWVAAAVPGGVGAAGGLLGQLVNSSLADVSQVEAWLTLVSGLILAVALRLGPDGIVSVWSSGFNRPEVEADRKRLEVPVPAWRLMGIGEVVAAPVLVAGMILAPLEYLGAAAAAAVALTRIALEMRAKAARSRRSLHRALVLLVGSAVLVALRIIGSDLPVFVVAQVLAAILFGDGSGKLSRRYMDALTFPRDRPQPVVPSPHRDPLALEVRDLTVRFGGVVALDGVSFGVAPGEVVGLIGPNGAGKTTLLDVVTGFTRPVGGEVLLDETSVARWAPERIARLGAIRSWQSAALFDAMTVSENLQVASDEHRRSDYLTNLVRPGRGQRVEVMEEVVAEFGLEPHLSSRPGELPHGIAKLVGVGRAFCAAPRLLLLDEPTAGLNTLEAAEVFRATRAMAERSGIGILVIEHDVPLLLELCDRLVVLNFGRKIAEGVPGVIEHDPVVVEAYVGTEHVYDQTSNRAERL